MPMLIKTHFDDVSTCSSNSKDQYSTNDYGSDVELSEARITKEHVTSAEDLISGNMVTHQCMEVQKVIEVTHQSK